MLSIGLEPIYIDYKTSALPIKPTQQYYLNNGNMFIGIVGFEPTLYCLKGNCYTNLTIYPKYYEYWIEKIRTFMTLTQIQVDLPISPQFI